MSAATLERAEVGSIESMVPRPGSTDRKDSTGPSSSAPLPASLSRFQRIVLTGFMGAGKSTVGRLLAEQLGWLFQDVDAAIEAKAGMPVCDIFSKYGEFVFRRMETSAIAHSLGERQSVIALGGGAPEVLANRLLLEQTPATAVVFLDAPLSLLVARCEAQQGASVRPNLQDSAAAEERFRYRMPLYRRCARFRIETAGMSVQQTTASLIDQLTAC